MKFFITFALFFLASYIVCQSILSRNVSTSSVNGVTTTIETVVWNNGSTVVTRTVTSGSSTTKTVTVTPTGSGSGSGSAQLIGTSTNTQNVNGVITVTVVNTYNNATTVTIKTVTQGNTITKTTTVASPFGTNTWTSVTTGGSPSTTSTTGGSPSTPRPSTPAPSTPRPSTPAPSTPRPSTPAPSTPAPSTPAPSTPAPTTSGSNTQNPVTLASSDPYSKFNYKVPSSISYAEIRNVHMEYINGARDCVGVNNATWDDTLAAHAQAWANTCQVFHANGGTSPANPSGNSDTVGEGENIYTFSGSNLRAVDAMVKGNEFFNKESKDFNCAGNSCSGVCGHYTQNVWYKTTKIGCGVAQCNGGFYGVCRYFPRGNFNQNTVHPLGSANNCNKGVGSARNQGYSTCNSRTQAIGRSLTANGAVLSQTTQTTATNTNANKSAPFFNSDSQIVVFALAIVITVIVAACFIVLVVVAKRGANKELDYQLLESK